MRDGLVKGSRRGDSRELSPVCKSGWSVCGGCNLPEKAVGVGGGLVERLW